MRIFVHSDFESDLDILTKKEAMKLSKIVDELFERLVTTQYKNHPLKNAAGLQDLHISDKIILMYKYDDKKDLLDITLRLVDVTNHDELQRKIDKFRNDNNSKGEFKELSDIKKLIYDDEKNNKALTGQEKLHQLQSEFECDTYVFSDKDASVTLYDEKDVERCFARCKELFDHAFIDNSNKDTVFISDSLFECLHEDAEEVEEPKLETFDEQMDFLAKDEQEAIDGYEKIIALVEDEHVKEQLEKILVEERAHKEFLEKVKEDHTLEYSHEEEHEEETKPLEDEIDINTVEVINDLNDDDLEDDVVEESLNEDLEEDDVSWLVPDKGNKKTKFEFDDEDDYVPTDEDIAENMADLNGENYGN